MGCDIHLRIEKRKRVNPYPNDRHEWHNVGIYGEFSSRIYGMFARMAKVRAVNSLKQLIIRNQQEAVEIIKELKLI